MTKHVFTYALWAVACSSTLLIAGAATAQETAARTFANPAQLEPQSGAGGSNSLTAHAPTPRAFSDEIVYDLDIDYITNQIWNPATGVFDQVRLRGYSGKGVDPEAPYVAPSIYARPGDTVRVSLNNKLPEDTLCNNWDRDVNIPHCFNTTNLHSHGLWINPAGNSDNVLLSISPGVDFQYEFNIPPDHPAGTFWYHPHRHGSTALQVGSGMAGALVIQGDRPPTAEANGDIDVLLRPTEAQPFTERLLVFQQIPYACRDPETKKIQGTLDDEGDYLDWFCNEGQIGTIENYDQFGPGTWPKSGRYTSINGHVQPTVTQASTGQIERWRLIHAGVRDTIRLQFIKRAEGAPALDGPGYTGSNDYIGAHCTGEPMAFHIVAADGLTTATAVNTTDAVLQPGYRWDALVAFDEEGTYCVIDADMPPPGAVDQAPRSRQLLGFVNVGPGQDTGDDPDAYLTEQLTLAAQANLPADVVDQVVGQLQNGLSLASFMPHDSLRDVPKAQVGDQHLTFYIDVQHQPVLFMIDGKPYEPTRIDRTLALNAIDDWTLTSDFVSHPFHIHVNPFEVIEILDPYGKDVSAPGAVDDCCGKDGEIDPQYRGMKGMWKDTIWVKNAGKDPKTDAPLRYQIKVRTKYRRYVGDFVLHCHILDHEDQGMMQNVRIALSDGAGGFASAHH